MPQRRFLDDGRCHFSSGPIDLVMGLTGRPMAVSDALDAGWQRFSTILNELVAELTELRSHSRVRRTFSGAVANRMERAVRPHARERFVTPMAAVAGAIADEMLETFKSASDLQKIYVNNGGDIAFHLSGSETMTFGMAPDLILEGDGPRLQGSAVISAQDHIRGVATSGRHGRSHSLGIADAVTVLATNAAEADVAATLIANAVDVAAPVVERVPACELDPDSDLGERPVTVAVGDLEHSEIADALDAGETYAQKLVDAGRIASAALSLNSTVRLVGAQQTRLIQQEELAWT